MKSKKVLTILLSMAIMLTFMPTLAFADDDPVQPDPVKPGYGYDGHWFVEDESKSTEATCEDYGITYYTCEGNEAYGLDCDATMFDFVPANPTGHDWQNVYISKDDFVKAIIEAYPTKYDNEKDVKALYAKYADACSVFVPQCTICGEYDFEAVKKGDILSHEPVKGTPACATTFECKYCHETLENTKAKDHPAITRNDEGEIVAVDETKATMVSTTDLPVCGTHYITEYKCNDCGETFYLNEKIEGSSVHTGLPAEVTPTDAEKTAKKYVQKGTGSNAKYYEYNLVTKAPTCDEPGSGTIKCEACGSVMGYQITEAVIPALGHKTTKITLPANHNHPTWEITYCTVCGEVTAWKEYNDQVAHDYTVEVVEAPNCFCDGITLIKCEGCGAVENAAYLDFGKCFYESGKKLYFCGFDGELAKKPKTEEAPLANLIDITDKDWRSDATEEKAAHVWGAYETIADASCELPELQARVCDNCGLADVHNVKRVGKALGHIYTDEQTVAPTCGTYGYSYCVCSRCNEFVVPDGAETSYIDVDVDGDGWYDTVYNALDPVVKPGEPCDLKWVRNGDVMQLKCQNPDCGYVETEVPYEDDTEREAAVEAAAPVIADANAKLAGNLTDASAKAIKDAKTALENAMLYGESAKSIADKTAALQTAVNGAKAKVANTMTAAAKTVKAKAKKTVKNKTGIVVSNPVGAVSYAKVSGNKKISVDPVTGKFKVKKGLKKGKKYKVTVAVTAAGDGNTLAKTTNVVVTVKVKK